MYECFRLIKAVEPSQTAAPENRESSVETPLPPTHGHICLIKYLYVCVYTYISIQQRLGDAPSVFWKCVCVSEGVAVFFCCAWECAKYISRLEP